MTAAEPIIEYFPNWDRHKERSPKIKQDSLKNGRMQLPPSFPPRISHRSVWSGNELGVNEWLVEYTNAQLQEIDAALQHFLSLKKPLGYVGPETFPLPTLGPLIRDILAEEIYNGRGFVVLRGIHVQSYTKKENAIIHAGLSSWLGKLRARQDPKNNIVLRHIIDLTKNGEIGTAQYTAEAQPFHTDWGDIVALYCLSLPASGGASHLASFQTIYNELSRDRPDIVSVLGSDWALDNFGGDPPYIERPLLFSHEDNLFFQYSRRLFTGYKTYRPSDACPSLTERQADAMEELERLAQKHAITFQMQQGDIQWLNNTKLLHARDEYVDDENHTRELLRIWARNEDMAPNIPLGLKAHWNQLYNLGSPETQIFFPEEENLSTNGEKPGDKKWTYAGNEGGIPK